MSMAALDPRAFDARLKPTWLRPAVLVAVVALHAAGLWAFTYLKPTLPEPPPEIVVDITPAPPEAEIQPPKETERVEPPPAAPQPPAAEAPPPLADTPPPEPAAPVLAAPPPPELPPPPVDKPAPPPAPVELAAPKPPPPKPPRVEAPRPQVKPAPKPAPQVRPAPKPAPVQPKPAQVQPKAQPAPKPAAPPAAAASAADKSAYMSEVAGAIRGRLFYPPAARARGAKGVVGVSFTIGPSGGVSGFSITRSSGDPDLDAAARSLVQSAHFPPPPGGSTHVSTSFNYVPR